MKLALFSFSFFLFPFALFLASALVGVWASYDPATSWRKFALLAFAVVAYYAIVALGRSPRLLEAFVYAFLAGCTLLAVYFVTQHDYAADSTKFGVITTIGLWLNRVTPQLGLHVSHPNVVAGALEIALPLNLALLVREKAKGITQNESKPTARRRGSSLWLIGSLSLSSFALTFEFCLLTFALLMSASRGSWLSLAVVAAGALALAVARDAVRRYAVPLAAIGLLLAAIVLLRVDLLPALDLLVGKVPAGTSAISRVELYGQAWELIQDYVYTGAGLGVFPMVLSTYALGLDVPFLTHAHNLFLQIWLEQGVVGVLAFVWIVAAFYGWVLRDEGGGMRDEKSEHPTVNSEQSTANNVHPSSLILHPLFIGAVAATTVMLLHGLVDVLLYSSRGLPLMFVPMGVAVASGQWVVSSEKRGEERAATEVRSREGRRGEEGTRRNFGFGIWDFGFGSLTHTCTAAHAVRCKCGPIGNWHFGSLLLAFSFLLLAFALAIHPSSLYSNLGAVEQTRVELSHYHWPDALVRDIRRTADLSQAEAYFQRALALDPSNVTANRRLALEGVASQH